MVIADCIAFGTIIPLQRRFHTHILMPTRNNRLIDFLFRRHGKELLAFAGQRSGSEVAEDLVQEAYLRLLQHPDPESIENPRAYLFRVTTNLGINHFHHERIRCNGANEPAIDPDTLISSLPGPESATEGALQIEQFLAILDDLPEACRDAFILHKLDGLTYPQVAKALGVSSKTAQRYIEKAWQHCLKRRIK